MKDFEHEKFIYLFWFCTGVFLLSFIAMMSLIFFNTPVEHRDLVSNCQGFLQGSLIMSAVGFLLSGNIITPGKKNDQKVTTEVSPDGSATVTTEPAITPKPEDNGTATS